MRKTLFSKDNSLLLGLFLLGFIPYIFAASTLFQLFSVKESFNTSLIIVFSYPIFTATYFWYTQKEKYTSLEVIAAIVACCGMIVICLMICRHFIDYSYDGQAYHGEAILQLANGWNPAKGNIFENKKEDPIVLAINHFSKASWVAGAFLYRLTGNFEMAKAGNVILILANLFIAYPFFQNYFPTKLSWLLSLLLSFNPVTLNMYLGNVLDSQITNLMYCTILLIALYIQTKNKVLLPFLYLSIIYLLNLKFTLVGYLAVFGFFLFLFLAIRKKIKEQLRFLVHLSTAYLLGILFFGYATYVRNYTEHGHPFYPFMGKNAQNQYIVDAFEYRTGNRIVNFIKSNFAATTFNQAYSHPLEYKWPFTVSRYELERFAFAGVMIGGFGVWFSGILLISLALLIYTILKYGWHERDTGYAGGIILIGIMVSIFINPLPYIARYIPQYYLIPFLAMITVILRDKNNIRPIYFLCFLMTINSFLICGYTYYNMEVSKKVNEQIRSIKSEGKPIYVKFQNHTSKRELFSANDIRFIEVDNFSDTTVPDTLFRSEVIYSFKK